MATNNNKTQAKEVASDRTQDAVTKAADKKVEESGKVPPMEQPEGAAAELTGGADEIVLDAKDEEVKDDSASAEIKDLEIHDEDKTEVLDQKPVRSTYLERQKGDRVDGLALDLKDLVGIVVLKDGQASVVVSGWFVPVVEQEDFRGGASYLLSHEGGAVLIARSSAEHVSTGVVFDNEADAKALAGLRETSVVKVSERK